MKTQKKQLDRIASSLEALSAQPSGRRTDVEPRTAKQIKKAQGVLHRPLMYRIRVHFTSPEKSHRAARARMAFPIMGFVGPNGGGKTACAVSMALLAMQDGRKVLSTVPLLDPATGEPHPNYVPWTHWDQLLDWWDGDVLADEVLSIASSRASASLDPRAQTLLVQLRKRNCRFWWTAPDAARCDVIIREVTQAITECRGFYADNSARQVRRGVIQSWSPKRLFSWMTYDTIEFTDWTTGKREKAEPLIKEWFHGPGSRVFAAYDTLEAVNVIATSVDGQVCDNCNGIVSDKPKPCRCRNPHPRPRALESTSAVLDESAGHVHADDELLDSIAVDLRTGELV